VSGTTIALIVSGSVGVGSVCTLHNDMPGGMSTPEENNIFTDSVTQRPTDVNRLFFYQT